MSRSIRLVYPDGLFIPKTPDVLQLPTVVHTRASRVLTSVVNPDGTERVVLQSEYDGIYDIQLSLRVENGVGYVRGVEFIEGRTI